MSLPERRKVLLSAYACEPGRGSEPGVGWNIASGMASYHDVWVITRAKNRPFIEAEMERNPISNLRFAYYDVPRWLSWWRRGPRGIQLYYYLWQIGVYGTARRLHEAVGFDLAHHVTFVKYWAPSLLPFLRIPFVWGPVGGGESAPRTFWKGFGIRGRIYEFARDAARWLGERDPLVRFTARRSSHAIATTPETASRLVKIGAKSIGILGASALNNPEIEFLNALPPARNGDVAFLSMGRLLHWKGFHLAVQAFARADIPNSRYVIIGEGPESRRLEALAKGLGIGHKVTLTGGLPREEALGILATCNVLVHPSLHDSGGWVCIEAMAAGQPVICLDFGGPATQVIPESGVVISAASSEEAVEKLAVQMCRLAANPPLRKEMGTAARRHVRENYRWSNKVSAIAEVYASI